MKLVAFRISRYSRSSHQFQNGWWPCFREYSLISVSAFTSTKQVRIYIKGAPQTFSLV